MEKTKSEVNNCIDKIVVDPFVAIRKNEQSGYLLFDSRITADTTRTLRVLALQNLADGVFVVEQGSSDGTVYSFRVSFWPQAATTQSGILEIAIITIDFNAAPFAVSNPAPDTETCNKWAAYFLSKLRNRVLETLGKIMNSPDILWDKADDEPRGKRHARESSLQNTPKDYSSYNHKSLSAANDSRSPSWFKWLGGSVAALFIVVLLIIITKSIDFPALDGGNSIRNTNDTLSEIERIQRDVLAARMQPSTQNPGEILGVNITEQTLKGMGLDPGKAADVNLGCLAQ